MGINPQSEENEKVGRKGLSGVGVTRVRMKANKVPELTQEGQQEHSREKFLLEKETQAVESGEMVLSAVQQGKKADVVESIWRLIEEKGQCNRNTRKQTG